MPPKLTNILGLECPPGVDINFEEDSYYTTITCTGHFFEVIAHYRKTDGKTRLEINADNSVNVTLLRGLFILAEVAREKLLDYASQKRRYS